jgi:hypothetical protein
MLSTQSFNETVKDLVAGEDVGACRGCCARTGLLRPRNESSFFQEPLLMKWQICGKAQQLAKPARGVQQKMVGWCIGM